MAGAEAEVHKGQSVYTPLFLKAYDVFVLGFSCRLVWRCPKAQMLAHYDRHIGARHLDVGVGTGYFLDKASWPTDPTLSLVDLNANSLAAASHRTGRFAPAATDADILQPLPELPHAPFDSVGVNFLLHCIPGALPDKATQVFAHVTPYVEPGGVVFGATILRGGVRRTPPARVLMAAYNRRGILHNRGDSLDGLTTALDAAFDSHTVDVVGCVALFAGKVAA
ncbi:MAG TPA: class I SAM-dependent methyltransferase [Acidimicrobiales bacterium]|nr:class I SAM-dependent methyltransferase [Acidimicrobiales bacterium]